MDKSGNVADQARDGQEMGGIDEENLAIIVSYMPYKVKQKTVYNNRPEGIPKYESHIIAGPYTLFRWAICTDEQRHEVCGEIRC